MPYCGRIKNGRFRFYGTEFLLQLNFGTHPHSIHGVGWQSNWQLQDQADDRIVLGLDYLGGGWPFRFEASQVLSLRGGDLHHELGITNASDRPMPAGLGMHPYFPRHGGARLRADVPYVWRTDDTCLPVERIACPPNWDLSRDADVAALKCDNQFEPWDRQARISWPADGMAVTLSASDDLDRLVVYAPEGTDFFCIEPVSHMTDAFNHTADGQPAAQTGMRELHPGETWRVWMRLSPERI